MLLKKVMFFYEGLIYLFSSSNSMYIKVFEDACPLCGGEVKGNFRYKYHCKNCNILFRESELDSEKNLVEKKTDLNKEIS